MRNIALTLALLSLAGVASAQSRRGIPRAARRVLEGCWEPWPGERWQISAHGATGLVVRLTFRERTLRQGRRFRIRAVRSYRDTLFSGPDGTISMGCGPTTQHGHFCLLTVEGRELRVARYSRGWGRHRHRGRLVETVTARRCHRAPR